MKPYVPPFERLEQIVTIVAQHVEFDGKQETVARVFDDIDDRWNHGLLTLEQRFQLCATLLRGTVSRRDYSLARVV
jgi:hypothetical protein